MKNMGYGEGGAITAALFLAEFVGDVPWAHIDIAGTAQSRGRQLVARPPAAPALARDCCWSLPLTFTTDRRLIQGERLRAA